MSVLAEKLPAVLARLLPDFLALQSCERLSGGASQETWRLQVQTSQGLQHFALRRAPGGMDTAGEATVGLEAEATLLAAALAAGVPEPRVLGLLEPADGMGAGFLMEWLEGEALGAQVLRSEALAEVRPRLARQCGEVLARIHAIDIQELRGLLPQRSAEQLVRETWETYVGYGTPQPMIDYTARWLLDHLPPACEPSLVHGDFRNGNLMIAPGQGIVGVLDWELAQLGDPMRDLGWLCTPSWRFGRHDKAVGGFGHIDELLEGYADAGGEQADPERLHWWIVFGAFWWAVGTLTMTQFHRQGPDRSVERAAIGRRSSECQVDCVNLLIPGAALPLVAGEQLPALEMPRADELLEGTMSLLREEVATAAKGRLSFLAKVAANSLEIVQRELQLGAARAQREQQGLESLLGKSGGLEALRRELCEGLRSGSLALHRPGLVEHLRQSVADQIAIDQPKYPGYRLALEWRL